jgi:hypothetical protein
VKIVLKDRLEQIQLLLYGRSFGLARSGAEHSRFHFTNDRGALKSIGKDICARGP